MAERLVTLYQPQDRVEITFGEGDWWSGVVVGHAHPGVWVRTADGRHWFVTNRGRIRHAAANRERGGGKVEETGEQRDDAS